MVFEVTHDGNILTLVESSELERKQLKLSLTRKLEKYNFLPPAVKAKWDGIISYFHLDKYVPIGLWNEVKLIAETYNFSLEINGLKDAMFYTEVSRQDFEEWIDEKFNGALNEEDVDFYPFDYQIETAYKIITNKICVSELCTGAGKSLIIFICIAYFQENNLGNRFLMIVPSIDLVIQAYEDFNTYNSYLLEENRFEFNMKQIHGGEKKDFTATQNIHIGTFQSLGKFDNKYFTTFDTVIVDEAHRSTGHTIKECISKCINSKRRFGLTGTVPKDGTLDSLTVQAYLGPRVIQVKAEELQKKGTIPDIDIAIVEFDYNQEIKERFDNIKKTISDDNRGKLLNLEQNFVIQYTPRLETISKIVNRISKNQLVLFHRKEYGKKIKKYLEENTDKEILFIYGEIPKDARKEIRKAIEQNSFTKEVNGLEFTIGNNTYRVPENEYVTLHDGKQKKCKDLKENDNVIEESIKKYLVC